MLAASVDGATDPQNRQRAWEDQLSCSTSLHISTGGDSEARVADIRDTYNYTMFTHALGFEIYGLNWQTAGEVVPVLRKAVRQLETYPAVYEAMNAPHKNMLKHYVAALEYLRELLSACETHPAAYIYMSY